MDSRQVSIHAMRRLQAAIARQLSYLDRLRQRMEHLGFPPSDALYQATMKAQHALQELHVETHYCSCKSGVGRRPQNQKPNTPPKGDKDSSS